MLVRKLMSGPASSPAGLPSYIGGAWGDTGGNRTGSVSLTAHASTQVGDLLIACVSGADGTGFSPDAGWTQINQNTPLFSQQAYWKIATEAGAQSYSFTARGETRRMGGFIQTWRNAAIGGRQSTYKGSGTTAISMSSIKPNADGYLLGFVTTGATTVTYTTPTGMTARANQNTNEPSMASFYQTVKNQVDTGIKSSTPSASGEQRGVMFTIKGA